MQFQTRSHVHTPRIGRCQPAVKKDYCQYCHCQTRPFAITWVCNAVWFMPQPLKSARGILMPLLAKGSMMRMPCVRRLNDIVLLVSVLSTEQDMYSCMHRSFFCVTALAWPPLGIHNGAWRQRGHSPKAGPKFQPVQWTSGQQQLHALKLGDCIF